MITRQPHWAERGFHRFLLDSAHKSFRWGKTDCALFAADAIQSITGVDIASDFRGKYTTEAGAMSAIKSVANGTTVADAAAYCAAKAGMKELAHPLMAQRGDLVVLEDERRLIAGVVHLSGHLVAAGENGLKVIPITAVKRAWHY